jgi:Fanconi anemia group M protein
MAIKIVVDMRESRSKITQMLQAMPEYQIELRDLPCGDYMVRDDFPVERKTATDFILSIQDRRLFQQTAKMKADYGRAAFIIEGDPLKTRSQMAPDAIIGAMSYLVAIEGAVIMPSTDPTTTAKLIATLARHAQVGLDYEVALRAGKPKELRHQAEFIAQGLPGVGGSVAKILLTHFGSVGALFHADVAALRQVPGIGEKTAKAIRAAIECQYQAAATA